MEPKRTPLWEVGAGYSLVALGCTFAAGIVLFMAGGWLLDRWLGTMPLFILLGTVIGATLSFLNVYVKLKAEAEAERRRREKTE